MRLLHHDDALIWWDIEKGAELHRLRWFRTDERRRTSQVFSTEVSVDERCALSGYEDGVKGQIDRSDIVLDGGRGRSVGETVSAADGFRGTRQNASVRIVRRGHPGNVG